MWKDYYKVSDHIETLNHYLKERCVDIAVVNTGKISPDLIQRYASLEQKEPVVFDEKEVAGLGLKIIEDDFVVVDHKSIRHNTMKLAFHIFSSLL